MCQRALSAILEWPELASYVKSLSIDVLREYSERYDTEMILHSLSRDMDSESALWKLFFDIDNYHLVESDMMVY